LSFIKKSGIEYELRTTCIPGFVNREILEEIGELTGDVKAYYLQQFSSLPTLLDNKYKSVEPFRIDYLNDLLNVVKNFSTICSIRGI
jgi:pyruvate formate lyase activating enzyme